MKTAIFIIWMTLVLSSAVLGQSKTSAGQDFLTWSASQAESIGKSMRVSDRVGNSFTIRGLKTERAINYKLRATLMTPEVIRAAARLEQLRNRLSDEQTLAMVADAEAAGDLIIMIELDPNEGSGVIPLDWRAILQPRGLRPGAPGAISAIKAPQLKGVKALAGVARRDYDYDVFWVVFPFTDANGKPVFPADVTELELIVGIYESEGRVFWTLPESVKSQIRAISEK